MPLRRCFVEGCPNEKYKRPKGSTAPDVGLFRPRIKVTDDIRRQWYQSVPPRSDGLQLDLSRSDHFICHLHFEEKLYEKDDKYTINGEIVLVPKARWALALDAVPNKFPDIRGGNDKVKCRRSRRSLKIPSAGSELIEELRCHDVEESASNTCEELQKEYYCSICLRNWTAGLKISESLKAKETMYQHFVGTLTRYLRLNLNDQIVCLGREKHEDKINSSSWYRTLCNQCFDFLTSIEKLVAEQELVKMKLNSELTKVYQAIQVSEWADRKAEFEKKEDMMESVKNAVEVCNEIVRKKNKYLIPRVILNPGNTSETRKVATKGKKLVTLTSTEGANTSQTLFFGTSAIVNNLGFATMLKCISCGKYFFTQAELEKHSHTYHSVGGDHQIGSDLTLQVLEGELEEVSVANPGCVATEQENSQRNLPLNRVESQDPIQIKTPTLVLNDTILATGIHPSRTIPFKGGGDIDATTDVHDEYKDDKVISCPPSPAVSSLSNDEEPRESEDAILNQTSTLIASGNGGNPQLDMGDTEKPKEEVRPMDDDLSCLKKVPFMSSEYIGKYKIVCKLKNIKTGQTCVGVVAKTPVSDNTKESINSSCTTSASILPRVISVQPPRQRTVKPVRVKIHCPPIFGPPYKCPAGNCCREFHLRAECVSHYRNHQRNLNRIQQKAESMKMKVPTKVRKSSKKKDKIGGVKVKNTGTRVGVCLKPSDFTAKVASSVSGEITKSQNVAKKGLLYRYYCQVEGCKFRFKKEASLNLHTKMAHTLLQCQFCCLTQPNLEQLISHEKGEHAPGVEGTDPEIYPYVCPRCNHVTSDGRHSIRNHYVKVHLQISTPTTSERSIGAKIVCTLCKFTTVNSVNYIRHVRKCYGESAAESIIEREFPLKCTTCGRRYRLQSALSKHLRMAHEGPTESQRKAFQCNVCSKVFTLRYRYETHMRKHAKLGVKWPWHRNNANFKIVSKRHPVAAGSTMCDICGKTFATEAGMLRHRLWHNHTTKPTRPRLPKPVQSKIECELCGKSWPNRGIFKYHMRRVHPEEAHRFELAPGEGVICHQCGKVYADKAVLHVHMSRYCPGTTSHSH